MVRKIVIIDKNALKNPLVRPSDNIKELFFFLQKRRILKCVLSENVRKCAHTGGFYGFDELCLIRAWNYHLEHGSNLKTATLWKLVL